MIDFESAPSSRPQPAAAPSGFAVKAERPEITPGYVEALNPQQKQAALITEGPLIVLAGAGSGKTKMLTSRIAFLIDGCRVPARNILAMTFTNKAAAEMRERVEKTLQAAARDPSGGGGFYFGRPEIGTFHSVCIRLLRTQMDRTPFSKPFVIYDDSDQLSLIKEVLDKLKIDEKSFSPKGFQAAMNRLKCDATEAHGLEPSAHNLFEKNLKRVYEQYQKDLLANNALDFGEIICMAYRILRDHEDVRTYYQSLYRYIHVDEYQDTNRSQYLLLSMLASSQFGGHQNICVVGDEDQSIYKWRGADIRNILDFERDYPGAQVVKLEQNYRSTETIICAAGSVIRNNRMRKDKTLWTENEAGEKVERIQVSDERTEAEVVVREIKRLASNEGRAFSDFAIFYRTNAQSRQFEDVLRREKSPYQIVGGLRFYDRKEIKDVLAYFKVILNPADSVSLKRIINVPARGIGKTTIEKLDEFYADLQRKGLQPGEKELNYATALEKMAADSSLTSAGTSKKLSQFVALLKRLSEVQPGLKLSELYHLLLDETGYVRTLRSEETEEASDRIENLEEFDTLLQEFEEDQYDNIPEEEKGSKKAQLLSLFLEQTTLASDIDSFDGAASAVKLMTLHSSKGLEFPVVFIAGMEEGLFPSTKPWEEESEEEIEEERRLCYVGMTRAEQKLYMLNAMVRRHWGNISYQDPSRFFDEIPENLIQFQDLSYSGSRIFRPAQAPEARPEFQPASGPTRLMGRRISHPEYGSGVVTASEGSGDDQKVTVEFSGREKRKFLFKYVASYLS